MTGTDAPPTGKDPAPPKPARPGRLRKWLRRLTRLAVVAVVLIVILRYAMMFALPSILEKVAAGYGLRCTYERLDVTFIGLDAELWHLVLAPGEGGEPYVDAEYCRADLAVLELFRGRLVVRRIESDGLDLLLERSADGTIPLLARFAKSAGPEPAPKAEAPPAATPASGEISFVPPVEIDALRLENLRAHIRDQVPSPPVDTRLELDLRLSDLASRTRPARFEVRLSSAPVLDSLRVEGELKAAEKELEATFRVAVQGLHPRELTGYLAPLGLRPVADGISLGMRGTARASKFTVPDPDEGKPGHPKKKPEVAVKASLQVEDVRAVADGEESFVLDRVDIDAPDIRAASIRLARLLVQGLRCEATRSRAGLVRAGGFELVPAAPGAPPPPAPPTAGAPGAPIAIRIDEVLLDGFCARLLDEAVDPPVDLALALERMSLRNVVLDPGDPEATMEIAGRLAAPGLVREITIAGSAKPYAPVKSLDLSFLASGIQPLAAGPYLRAAGLASTLKAGSLELDLHALLLAEEPDRLVAEARLERLRLMDQEELLVLDQVRLSGIDIQPAAARIGIEGLEVAGPRLSAARDAEGAINLLGLRLIPGGGPAAGEESLPQAEAAGDSAKPAPKAAAAASANVPAAPFPKIAIDRLLWKGLRVDLADAAVNPPAKASLEDAGLEITGISIDLDPAAPAPAPGKLRGWASAPGLVGGWTATGTLVTSPRMPSVDLEIAGKAIAPSAMAAHLRAAGLESVLKDGSLELHLGASAFLDAGGAAASLSVEKLSFADDGAELLGLDAFRVTGASVRADGVTVEAIEILRPRAAVTRDGAGALIAAGLRLSPKAPAAATDPAAARPDTPPAPAPAGPPEKSSPPPPILLKSFRLQTAGLRWADQAVSPAVSASATVSASVDGLSLGREGETAAFMVSLHVEDALELLVASGALSAAPRGLEAMIELSSSGIRAGPLAAYLPPGAEVSLKDGRFRARIEAGIAPHAGGGHAGRFMVSGVDFRDGQEGAPLFQMEDFRVLLSRLDLPARVVAVEEISLHGLETDVERTSTGAIRLLGLSLQPPPPAAPPDKDRSIEVAAAAPENGAVKSAEKGAPAGADDEKARIAAIKPVFLPLITLGKLDLNLRRITLADASRPGSAPLSIAGLRLAAPTGIELLGDEPEARPPAKLELSGGITPLVGSFRLGLELFPFAPEPGLRLDFSAEGIRGAGINELLPELKELLDGAPLADGRFRAKVETIFKVQRRNPIALDLSRGIGLEFLLKEVEFRDGADGPILAGLDELRVEGVKVEPAVGSVRIRSVEIVKPAGRVLRDKEGIHILNLRVLVPPPTEVEGGVVVTKTDPAKIPPPPEGADKPGEAAPTVPPVAPPSRQGARRFQGESRIDRLMVSGIDFTIEDRSAEPAMVIPLAGLEADVKNITTRAMTEEQDIRFSVFLRSGKAPLPAKEAGKFEDRVVFEEIALSGDLFLYPRLRGWVKAGVGALDLTAFKGPASVAGVTIGGGVLDSSVNIRFQKDGSLETGSRTHFTDLSMSESANGPIRSLLGLSAPLDTVLFLLRNESGSIKIPLKVQVGADGVSLAQVSQVALVTLSTQIGKAILNSPFRVVSPVTGLLTLGQDEKVEESAPSYLQFLPGDAALGAEEMQKLAPALQELRGDANLQVTLQHEVGPDDIARASVLANPSPADALVLAERLGRRKAELLAARAPAAAQARGTIAAGDDGRDRQAGEDLRAIDRNLARTEDALDRVYDVLRPGADRQRLRRTREACISFGRERIEAVRAALRASGIEGIDGRIRVVPVRYKEIEGPGAGRVTMTLRKSAPASS